MDAARDDGGHDAPIQQSDDQLFVHLTDCRVRSEDLARRLRVQPPPLPVDGWYVPQEVDDLNWQQPAREQMLVRYLSDIRTLLAKSGMPGARPKPLYVSAFFGGFSDPGAFAAMLARVQQKTGVIWAVQDGLGTARMSEARTGAYLQAIARTLPASGWRGLLEVFDEQKVAGQSSTFAPSADHTVAHRRAVWCASAGRLPEMAFSLNQRMAQAGLVAA